ncbi:MAG: PDZ domain-containing protein [Rudaea sp.]
MRLGISLALILCLTACASGYTKFYTQIPGATPEAVAAQRAAPPPEMPIIEHSRVAPDQNLYARRGYSAIGYSSFNSGHSEQEKSAIAQAKKVGADLVVVVNPSYTGTVSSEVPITTPTSTTSYTSGSATAYGSGGSATAYGNSTTTTFGSKTTYIPVSTARYDYGAVYFVKRKYIFGANWRDLSDAERSTLQSNSGVYVTSVVNDTPAFRNDVLAGDIIVKIDGQAVYGTQAASEILHRKRGQPVELTIYRNGHVIDMSIKLSQ